MQRELEVVVLVSVLLLSSAVLAQARRGGASVGQSGSSSGTQGSATTNFGAPATTGRGKANRNSKNRRPDTATKPNEPKNKEVPGRYKVWRISPQ